jgi:transposase
MGLAERDGRLKAVVILNIEKNTLRDLVPDKWSRVLGHLADELVSYSLLSGDGFTHGLVHGAKEDSYY